jgi:nitrogen fixation protein FixH
MTSVRSYKGIAWALVPVVILGAMFVGWGVMITLALNDPAFGIEPDYYDKAVHFDELQAQARESHRLGWALNVEPQADGQGVIVRVTLKDRELRPIDGATVRATAFHNARSTQLRELEFRGDGDGHYTARLSPYRRGLWEFRFEVVKGSERFLQVTRLSLEDQDGP